MQPLEGVRSTRSNFPDIETLVTWNSSDTAMEVDQGFYIPLSHAVLDRINLQF